MNSRLYTGTIMHARLHPRQHAFTYRCYFYGIDLQELDLLDRSLSTFGYNKRRLSSLYDRDYLEPTDERVLNKFTNHWQRAGMTPDVARVMLITSLRLGAKVFNPISVYVGLGTDGLPIGMLAEVNNTFGDKHLYALPTLTREGNTFRASHAKQFHVSPFNNSQGDYHFELTWTPDNIDLRITLHRDGRDVLRTRLAGQAIPLTAGRQLATIARMPLAALATLPRIHIQALKLYFRKRLKIYARPEPTDPMTIKRRQPNWIERWAMRLVLAALARINKGLLTVSLPNGEQRFLGHAETGACESLTVNRYRFFTRVVLRGAIGFGEAYVEDDMDTPDLSGVLKLLIHNEDCLRTASAFAAGYQQVRDRLQHRLHRNTKRQGRHNIHAHYDLSNDFFRTFLDPSMTYSCARFDQPGDTLETAQRRKLHSLIQKARIHRDHHVLEIGTGWGSFALETASTTGCRVTSVTISSEQYALAKQRIRDAGLQERVDVQLCDYRDIRGSYDRIVSIEMLEAVGHDYLPKFFSACDRLLAPNGILALQVITIPDHRYEGYRRRCDWIQKYIFPGGHLPSLAAITAALARATSLRIEHLENIGPDYARTLREWHEAFLRHESRVRELGMDTAFIRKWAYYLCYCEAGFATRTLDTLQLVITASGNHDLDDSTTRLQTVLPGASETARLTTAFRSA